jgi:ADP-ribose pyrophosphatase
MENIDIENIDKVLDEQESKILNKKTLWEGINKNKVEEITFKDGDEEIKEEFLNFGNVSSALIYDTNLEKYIFIEQYRPTVNGKMVEVVSDKILDGEKPEETIKRTILDKTGYKVDKIDHISDFYISPSNSDEIMALFYIKVSEKISEPPKNIKVVEVNRFGMSGKLHFQDELSDSKKELIPSYQLIDAKSIIAVNWIESNKVLKDMADIITDAKLRTF